MFPGYVPLPKSMPLILYDPPATTLGRSLPLWSLSTFVVPTFWNSIATRWVKVGSYATVFGSVFAPPVVVASVQFLAVGSQLQVPIVVAVVGPTDLSTWACEMVLVSPGVLALSS